MPFNDCTIVIRNSFAAQHSGTLITVMETFVLWNMHVSRPLRLDFLDLCCRTTLIQVLNPQIAMYKQLTNIRVSCGSLVVVLGKELGVKSCLHPSLVVPQLLSAKREIVAAEASAQERRCLPGEVLP